MAQDGIVREKESVVAHLKAKLHAEEEELALHRTRLRLLLQMLQFDVHPSEDVRVEGDQQERPNQTCTKRDLQQVVAKAEGGNEDIENQQQERNITTDEMNRNKHPSTINKEDVNSGKTGVGDDTDEEEDKASPTTGPEGTLVIGGGGVRKRSTSFNYNNTNDSEVDEELNELDMALEGLEEAKERLGLVKQKYMVLFLLLAHF